MTDETAPGSDGSPAEASADTSVLAPTGSPAGFERRKTPTVSVITPSFNEAGNIVALLEGIDASFDSSSDGMTHEIIVVDDDSPDRTWELAETYAETHPWVSVIRRFGESGLSSAVVAGMEFAKGDVLAVIDADRQHDEAALPAMVKLIAEDHADVVVGTRAAEGGSYGEFSASRRLISSIAAFIARFFLRVPVSDPMSGYFAISRKTFIEAGPKINPQGFKILLEFIGRRSALRIAEVGYTFRRREYGETKLSPSVIRSYLLAVFELRIGRQVKGQFFLYSIVGASGILVSVTVFTICEAFALPTFNTGSKLIDPVDWSVLIASEMSIITNFLGNNYFTFWERRFRRKSLPFGFLIFQVVSLFGVLVHLGVFHFLQSTGWGFSAIGEEPARWVHNVMGLGAGLVSNYFLNVNYTWRRRIER